MNKKGVVLVISCMVMAVLLILTGAYFSSLITEKRSADSEKFVLQALGLAEGGTNHAFSELRERVRTDLKNNVQTVRQAAVIQAYITNNDSLGFLRDYAYAAGDTQFTISAGVASLSLAALGLNTAVQGNYIATMNVTANGNPVKRPSGEIYDFNYNFNVEAQGRVTNTTPATTKTIRLVQGSFKITVRRDSFAKYALFTEHHSTPSGTTVWFTSNTNFTGPVHTDDRFSFANNPSGIFTEEVTQHQNTARFYNSGWPRFSDSATYPACCEREGCWTIPCLDKPTFNTEFNRGEPIINLPSSVSQADMRKEALGTTSEPGANGIYINNDGTNLIGGIYVKGNSTVNMGTDASDHPVYTITQGSTTKTVTVDYANNQTKVQQDATTNIYNGIPDGVTETGGTLIYTKDNITSFSGTVQQDTSLTVASERDIVITDNVRYAQYNTSPTLNAEGYTNLLGILSWGGNVRIGTSAPNNVNIHGVVMAPHGIFTVDNYDRGSPRGTATLLGGAIADFYGAFGTFSGANPVSGYGRNFVYDARMLQGQAPPYFPYMANFISFDDGALDNRLVWQDKGV
jgi:hypothetical protein